MKIQNHSSAWFVTNHMDTKDIWISMLEQFMKMQNHSLAWFVTKNLVKKDIWIHMSKQFMKLPNIQKYTKKSLHQSEFE